jgi:hypothetical protein
MFAILYNPTASQTKFIITNKALELVRSTLPSGSSQERNAFDTFNMPLTGFMIAMVVIEIEKTLRFFPDIQSMNPFIAICFPGENAMDMALDCFRARMATACFCSAAVLPASPLAEWLDFCSISLSTDRTRPMSHGAGFFWSAPYPTSHSRKLRFTDQRLRWDEGVVISVGNAQPNKTKKAGAVSGGLKRRQAVAKEKLRK